MRILNIVETAYRGTLEEKDDTVLAVTGALRDQGGEVSMLLRGNAVNYLVKGQESPGRVRRLDEDVRRLTEKGVVVYAIREDARDRGLDPGRIIAGVEFVSRSDVADLLERFDQIWSW
jgi:sulfur relay (sulfurtransferase) DsrF/TusC family protein